jgi:hypothetical protein
MIRRRQHRTMLATAIAVGAIAAAGCSSQGNTTSPPAALSAPRSADTSTAAPTPTPTTTHTPVPTSPSSTSTTPATTPTRGCMTSAAKGACGPYGYPRIQGSSQEPTVAQDVWNPIPGWHQTLHAIGPGNWHVTASMPAGNTAVVSFPDTGAAYDEQRLSKFSKIYSSFSENMHATSATSAWAAYDLWFNNWGNEVMIQHDFADQGPCPFLATQAFGGSGGIPVQTWGLCRFGSELIWKLTGGNEQTGSVNILSMVTWLEKHGYMPSSSTITDLSYGFEICSTGGRNENFQVNSFSITAS